uniref:G-protein coupled receptors family 1 profile domain-containing protein n=1 Tax=Ditylenchus dipsaci TaxID=166011 RepID=A0A915CPR7_9BILA
MNMDQIYHVSFTAILLSTVVERGCSKSFPIQAYSTVKQVLSDMLLKNNASVGQISTSCSSQINAVFTTIVSSDHFGGTSMVSSTAFAPAASMLQSSSFSDLDAQTRLWPRSGVRADDQSYSCGWHHSYYCYRNTFAFATTAGNLMVMISIRLDKQLQTISNYFLFSLAVADLTIGFISIPLMTYYTAVQYWGIGYAACQFWLSVDYLMSNASVLNLLLISFDRYFSVTRPLTYRPRRTTEKALIMIAGTFIISLVLWPPWIIGWPYIEGKFTVEEGTCVVQFLAVSGRSYPRIMATIGTAIAAFYLPVTIMIILYYRVFKETKRRQEELRKLQAGQFSPTQFGATSALHSLMLPLIRGMGGAAAYPISSSFTSANGNENGLTITPQQQTLQTLSFVAKFHHFLLNPKADFLG